MTAPPDARPGSAPDAATDVGRAGDAGPPPGVTSADATEAAWVRLSADLRRFIARRVHPSDVDDVLQAVFLRLHTRLGTVADGERVTGWIYTVTRNVIVDHHRSAQRRREVAVPELPPERHPVLEAEDDDGAAERELAGCLRPLLTDLPPAQAAALQLVEVEGLSQVEAARVAGISVPGMKSRVQRGRARLRDLLLACCEVAQDPRGRVHAWQPRAETCACGAGPAPTC